MSNEITAYFKGRTGTVESVYQYDYGMILKFSGITLPSHFDCYFEVPGEEESIPAVGSDSRVTIPNGCLTRAGEVKLTIPLHTGADDSEVEYIVRFKVIGRARPADDGTPAQMTAIEQALALLEHPVEGIEEIVDTALTEAKESGEFDGFSPTVTIDDEGDNYTVTVTDASGEHEYELNASNYNKLANKPSINGVGLSGNKTFSDLGLASAAQVDNLTAANSNKAVTLYNERLGQGTITLAETIANFDYIDLEYISITTGVGSNETRRIPATAGTYDIVIPYTATGRLGLMKQKVTISGTSFTAATVETSYLNTGNSTINESGTEHPYHINKILGIKLGSASPAELTDLRIGADGVTDLTAGASVRRQFTDLKSAINVVFNGGEKASSEIVPTVITSKAINALGEMITTDGYNATDYVELPDNTTHLSIHSTFAANLGMAFYNPSKGPLLIINGYNISSYGGTNKSEPQTIVFAVPPDTKYIRATMRDYYYTEASDFDIFPLINFPSAYEEISQLQSDVLNIASLKVGKNLVDSAKVVTGAIESNGVVSTEGSYANYITSDYIPISPSKSYTLSSYAISSLNVSNGRKMYLLFDEDKNLISSTYTNQSGVTELAFNNANAHFVRVSTSNDCYLMVEQGARTSYVPYTETFELNPALPLTDAMKAELTNSLSGKKYVACGDSFTEYTSIIGESNVKNELTWDSALGVYKTYPWWIAKRNNMVLVNEAVSGSTMTYIDGNHHEFSTPNGRYTQIPDDADYITLKFGINDENNQVPIGSIDDAVNTTFYGAWNIVLEYLITNHPYAKIGIIVSNGSLSQELINATVAVAEKWGIAYYNENSNDVPLLHRTTGRNASETAKALRLNQFKISNTDTHPNYLAQKFESTMIESFIKRL